MRYSVFAGGKRIRPILCLEAARIFEAEVTPALYPGCAIEFIHTYSLIHDDLPALDNDDLRRGKPTSSQEIWRSDGHSCGRRAVDAGIRDHCGVPPFPRNAASAMVTEIATAAGTVNGMVGGQVADLESEGKKVGPDNAGVHSPFQDSGADSRVGHGWGTLRGRFRRRCRRGCGDLARPSAGRFR